MIHKETTESKILREYYTEKDFISSPDGILKVFSVIACIVTGVCAFAAGGSCARAPSLVRGAGGVALASAAGLALLTAFALLAAPQRKPLLWLYTDVLSSTVVSVLLVVAVILGAIFCELDSALNIIYFVSGVLTVSLTTASAVVGYAGAMRRVDAARPRLEPHRPAPTEQDA